MFRADKKISIKTRMIQLQLFVAFVILFVCSMAFILNDLIIFKRSVVRSLDSTAKILGQNLAPTLAFSDRVAAEQILASLKSERSIESARLFDQRGGLFATYGAKDGAPERHDPSQTCEGVQLKGTHVSLCFKIIQAGDVQGFLFLNGDLLVFAAEYRNYLGIVSLVFLMGLFISLGLAHWSQRSLSEPISLLARTAKEISTSGNYAIRMQNHLLTERILEIETLSTEFNQMLDQIQSKDLKIQAANLDLERKVEERTAELKETQSLLIQTSKMSALGEMAGGVAHEINTPLAIIHLTSNQLQERLDEDPLDRDGINKLAKAIDDTTNRIAKIVNGLRSFSRDATNDPLEIVSVQNIINDALTLCSEKYKNSGVELLVPEIALSLKVSCRPIQVAQVLINLLNNAYDAIESFSEKWIKIEVEARGQQIEIRIMNSGPPISPEIRQKLFQPFFTTKEVGKGTGLGLSISRGIVAAHGGTISFSETSPYTQVVIVLPAGTVTTPSEAA